MSRRTFYSCYHEQKSLLAGSLPGLGIDVARRGKIVRTPTIRNSFPYVHAKLGSEAGDWLGFSKKHWSRYS